MSNYGGFVRGGEHTDDVAQQQSTNGTGVVILAPKQAPKPAGEADAPRSTILNIRKALQKSTDGRAKSPDSPPAGRRRASPTYETFKARGSPTYEPAKPCGSPSYQPHSKAAEDTTGLGHAAGQQDSPAAKRSGTRSRSSSRCRSSSRSRSRSRNRHRHRSSTTGRRHRSRSSSRTGHKAKRRSSRDTRRSQRHKRSRSRSRTRGIDRSARSRSRDRKKSQRHEHSRHICQSDRQRSASPVIFSRQEKGRAWADERAFNTVNPVRRGKQGLGFAGDVRPLQQRPEPDAEGDLSRQRSSRGVAAARAGGTASGRSSKWVSGLDAAALIPGYDQMAPAEKLKARMRLVLSKAEQQSAAAEAAAAGAVGPSGLGEAAVTTDISTEGWTRFVFDQHGELEEDKHARQKLMDSATGQLAMGGFGNAADDTVDTAAAFIMGTGRVAAQRAGLAQAAEAAHDDAIFGRPYGASSIDGGEDRQRQQKQQDRAVDMSNNAAILPLHNGSAAPEHASIVQGDCEDDAKQLAASLGVSEVLVVEQQKPGLSWRERALAMRVERQQ